MQYYAAHKEMDKNDQQKVTSVKMMSRINDEQQPKPLVCVCVGGGGLNVFYWRQIFALDYVFVVKTQKIFSSHGGFLTNAMHHQKQSNQINTL